MERPPHISEAAWATMTPELRANVIAAIQTAVKQNEDGVTKEVTKQVTKKVREELKLFNLMQIGGPAADSAKALLKASVVARESNYVMFCCGNGQPTLNIDIRNVVYLYVKYLNLLNKSSISM